MLDRAVLARLRKGGLSSHAAILEDVAAQVTSRTGKRVLVDRVDYQTAYRISWIYKSLSAIGPHEKFLYSVHRTPEAAIEYLQTEWARASRSIGDVNLLDRGWAEPLMELDEKYWALPKWKRTNDQFPGQGLFPTNGWKQPIPIDIIAVSPHGEIWNALREHDTISHDSFFLNWRRSREDFMEECDRAGQFKFEAHNAMIADQRMEFERQSGNAYITGRYFGLLPYRNALKLGKVASARPD